MPKIVSKARQLRLDYQSRIGRTVTMTEVAEQAGVNRTTLNLIELGQTKGIDFETLTKLCVFYSGVLGSTIGVGDVLEFDPNRQAPVLA